MNKECQIYIKKLSKLVSLKHWQLKKTAAYKTNFLNTSCKNQWKNVKKQTCDRNVPLLFQESTEIITDALYSDVKNKPTNNDVIEDSQVRSESWHLARKKELKLPFKNPLWELWIWYQLLEFFLSEHKRNLVAQVMLLPHLECFI